MGQFISKRTLITSGLVLCASVFLFFSPVLSGETVKGKPLVKEKAKKVSSQFNVKRIGCLLPTSGAYANYGVSAQKGVDLAYLTFIANGNNTGLQIEYRDTGSNPAKTKQAIRELAELGVAAIIGPVGPAEDAAKEAQAFGIPIITLTGKDGITSLGDCVFRHFLTQTMQVKSVTEYAFNTLELRRFAVLYPDESYGRDMMKIFTTEVKRRGGVVVAAESYALKTTDFGKQIKKIIGVSGKKEIAHDPNKEWPETMVGIDGVFIPDTAETVGLILPQLRFYDVNDVILLGSNLWHSDKLVSMAGKYLSQAVIPEGFFVESEEPQVVRFVERFMEAYNSKPGFVEAISYDTALMAFHVIAQKPASYNDFKRMLVELQNVRGVTGITSFGESGEAEKMIYLLRGNPDGFVEISR